MAKTVKNNAKKRDLSVKSKPKRKSKFTLFWEKYPKGIGEILDLEAVLQ